MVKTQDRSSSCVGRRLVVSIDGVDNEGINGVRWGAKIRGLTIFLVCASNNEEDVVFLLQFV